MLQSQRTRLILYTYGRARPGTVGRNRACHIEIAEEYVVGSFTERDLERELGGA